MFPLFKYDKKDNGNQEIVDEECNYFAEVVCYADCGNNTFYIKFYLSI